MKKTNIYTEKTWIIHLICFLFLAGAGASNLKARFEQMGQAEAEESRRRAEEERARRQERERREKEAAKKAEEVLELGVYLLKISRWG